MRHVTKAMTGGYIVRDDYSGQHLYPTLEGVLANLLQHFEGRAPSFTGDMYGRVIIERERPAAQHGAGEEKQEQETEIGEE